MELIQMEKVDFFGTGEALLKDNRGYGRVKHLARAKPKHDIRHIETPETLATQEAEKRLKALWKQLAKDEAVTEQQIARDCLKADKMRDSCMLYCEVG